MEREEKYINILLSIVVGLTPALMYLCSHVTQLGRDVGFDPICTPIVMNGNPDSSIDITFAPQGFTDHHTVMSAIEEMIVSYNSSGFMDMGVSAHTNFSVVNVNHEYGINADSGGFDSSSSLNKIKLMCNSDIVVILDNADRPRELITENRGLAEVGGSYAIVEVGRDGNYYYVFKHEVAHCFGMTHGDASKGPSAMSPYTTNNLFTKSERNLMLRKIEERFGPMKQPALKQLGR